MNKRNFNSVCSMYRQGISTEVCINLIIDFCKKKNSDPSHWIMNFFGYEIINPLKAEIAILTAASKGGKGKV